MKELQIIAAFLLQFILNQYFKDKKYYSWINNSRKFNSIQTFV
jgi:hypothetical protein